MKKLYLLSAAALMLAAASCSEGLSDEQTPETSSPLSLHAVIGSESTDALPADDQTRVTLTDPGDGSMKQVWKQFDQLTVINGSGSSETTYTFAIDDATAGTKTATFNAPSNYTGTPAFALHPAVFNLNPAAWEYTKEFVQSAYFPTDHLRCPLYAKYDPADGSNLYFRPLMAILRFDITLPAQAEGAVTRLRLSADDGSTPFFVNPVFDLRGETATLTAASTASNDILLKVTDMTLPADKHVTLYLPATPTDQVAGKALTLEVSVGSRLYAAQLTGGAIRAGKSHTITRNADAWTSTDTYASGTGTSTDPYVLTSLEHLRTLARRTSLLGEPWSGNHFRLDNNISGIVTTPQAPWLPIGMEGATSFNIYFRGNFDGGGHTVSGTFHFTTPYAGLFGYTSKGQITDLTVEGDIISDYSGTQTIAIGGIAGYATDNATIRNCHHKGSVICKDKTNQISGGGIAGSVFGTIEGCTQANGTIELSTTTTDGLFAGGITGRLSSGTITDCSNASEMIARKSGSTYGYVGGLVGMAGGTLHTSYNSGNVTGDGINTVGALAGDISTSGKVYKCSSFASGVVVTVNGYRQDPVMAIGRASASTVDCPDGHSAPVE